MKSISLILAFYMMIGSLIPKTDFSQLLHVPDLIEHYQLHQEEAQLLGVDFDFFDFVVIHFFSPDEHQHDHPEEHDNLPFQSFHASTLYASIDVDDLTLDISNSFGSNTLSYSNQFYFQDFSSSLFHPPSHS